MKGNRFGIKRASNCMNNHGIIENVRLKEVITLFISFRLFAVITTLNRFLSYRYTPHGPPINFTLIMIEGS